MERAVSEQTAHTEGSLLLMFKLKLVFPPTITTKETLTWIVPQKLLLSSSSASHSGWNFWDPHDAQIARARGERLLVTDLLLFTSTTPLYSRVQAMVCETDITQTAGNGTLTCTDRVDPRQRKGSSCSSQPRTGKPLIKSSLSCQLGLTKDQHVLQHVWGRQQQLSENDTGD